MAGLRELVLELTDRCPQRCLHCSSNSEPSCAAFLSRDLVRSLLRQAEELGAEQVSFGGGEPLCAPLFFEAVEAVAAAGMRAEVFTCGLTLDDGKVRPIGTDEVARLRDLPDLRLVFSMHGPDAEVHDAVSEIPGSFADTTHVLDACLGAGIACEINFVPLRINAHSFADLVAYAADRGIRKVSVLRFVPQGRGLHNRNRLELGREEEDAFVERLLELRTSAPLQVRTGSPFNGIVPGNAIPCRAGAQKLVVQAHGNVLPCEVFKHRQTRNWGLSAYQQPLRDILRSPQIRALRALLHRAHCLACPVHSALRSAEATGSPHAHEQFSKSAVHV